MTGGNHDVASFEQATYTGDAEDVALAQQADLLGQRVTNLLRRLEQHAVRKPVMPPISQVQHQELQRWQRESEELQAEIEHVQTELAQLLEYDKDWNRRHLESRAEEVVFSCENCGVSITTTRGAALDEANVVCPSCNTEIKLYVELC